MPFIINSYNFGVAFTRTDFGPYIFDNNGFASQGAGPYTTSSFTPPNNSVLVVFNKISSGSIFVETDVVVTDSTALTWTKRISAVETFNPNTDTICYQIWTAPVTTGASMTITSTHTGVTAFGASVHPYAFVGHNIASPVGATGSSITTGTTNAITLSASPNTNSEVLGWINVVSTQQDSTNTTVGPDTGWTEITEAAVNDGFSRMQTQFRRNSTSDQVTWQTTSTESAPWDRRVATAIEIKKA